MNVKFVAAFFVKERFMSKDNKPGQRIYRQQTPTKIIVERHCVGTEEMEKPFKR